MLVRPWRRSVLLRGLTVSARLRSLPPNAFSQSPLLDVLVRRAGSTRAGHHRNADYGSNPARPFHHLRTTDRPIRVPIIHLEKEACGCPSRRSAQNRPGLPNPFEYRSSRFHGRSTSTVSTRPTSPVQLRVRTARVDAGAKRFLVARIKAVRVAKDAQRRRNPFGSWWHHKSSGRQ